MAENTLMMLAYFHVLGGTNQNILHETMEQGCLEKCFLQVFLLIFQKPYQQL